MSTYTVVSVTDDLLEELEAIAQDASFVTREPDSQEYLANLAARILAERAELKRDSARYRWLCQSMWYVGPDNFFCGEGGDMNDYENHNYRADTLDAAIDAAMQS